MRLIALALPLCLCATTAHAQRESLDIAAPPPAPVKIAAPTIKSPEIQKIKPPTAPTMLNAPVGTASQTTIPVAVTGFDKGVTLPQFLEAAKREFTVRDKDGNGVLSATDAPVAKAAPLPLKETDVQSPQLNTTPPVASEIKLLDLPKPKPIADPGIGTMPQITPQAAPQN